MAKFACHKCGKGVGGFLTGPAYICSNERCNRISCGLCSRGIVTLKCRACGHGVRDTIRTSRADGTSGLDSAAGGCGCLLLLALFYFCGFGGCGDDATTVVPADPGVQAAARDKSKVTPTVDYDDLSKNGKLRVDVDNELRDQPEARRLTEAALESLEDGKVENARLQIDRAIYETDGLFSEPPSVVITILQQVIQAQLSVEVIGARCYIDQRQFEDALARIGAAQRVITENGMSKFKPVLNTDMLQTCTSDLQRGLSAQISDLLKDDMLEAASDRLQDIESLIFKDLSSFNRDLGVVERASDINIDRMIVAANVAIEAGQFDEAEKQLKAATSFLYGTRSNEIAALKKTVTVKREGEQRREMASTTNWFWRCPNTAVDWRIESSLGACPRIRSDLDLPGLMRY